MSNYRKPKGAVYYTRSPRSRNRQIVAVMEGGTDFRFTMGNMKSELAGYDLSAQELQAIATRAYKKARAFVPEHDKYLVKDSTGYYEFPNPPKDCPQVSEQDQRDLDIVQNLLSELQDLSVA